MESSENLAYLAGIVDGEGCIRIHKQSKRNCYSPMITVVNTNPILVDWLRFFFGGSVGVYHSGNTNWKDSYNWRLTGIKAIELLQQIRPYLRLKAQQADKLLAFWRIHEIYGVIGGGIEPSPWEYVEEAERFVHDLSILNRKGTREATGKELNYGR